MPEGAVVYKLKYGCTEKHASWNAEATGAELYQLIKASQKKLSFINPLRGRLFSEYQVILSDSRQFPVHPYVPFSDRLQSSQWADRP